MVMNVTGHFSGHIYTVPVFIDTQPSRRLRPRAAFCRGWLFPEGSSNTGFLQIRFCSAPQFIYNFYDYSTIL